MKIGTWNGYNVNMIKDKSMVDGVYWTVTDSKGKEHNRFESKESFSHWMIHSGFIPNNANNGG